MVPSAPLISPIWASSRAALCCIGGWAIALSDMSNSCECSASAAVLSGVRFGIGRLRELLGEAKRPGARLHLVPDRAWLDAGVEPESYEVIEQISALADDAIRIALDHFNSDFAGFLDHLARKLAAP